MQVHLEIVFRPRNRFHRFLAWYIGAPTMAIVRAGERMDPVTADFYTASALLVARDHKKAEIEGLSSPVTFPMYAGAKRQAAAKGLKVRWVRHKPWGIVNIEPK